MKAKYYIDSEGNYKAIYYIEEELNEMNKTLYVNQLSKNKQEAIRFDINRALTEMNMEYNEHLDSLDNALNSRLSDLTDLIDINPYI